MDAEENYIEINKKLWNAKTQYHVNSAFYDNDAFVKGKSTLNQIELDLLGNVAGKSILHLQCHFGQDSISLSRLGANVTGIDLSDAAINQAKALAQQVNTNTKFICCNIYDLPNYLNQKFDIVFTSYGTIGWLPNLSKWANIVKQYLVEDGEFIMADFHPFVWMYDNDFTFIQYNYFKSDAIVEQEMGTYADKNAPINLESVGWNHSISEILSSLLENNLTILKFKEYNFSPYNCFVNMYLAEPNKFRFKKYEDKLPIVYAILAKNKL